MKQSLRHNIIYFIAVLVLGFLASKYVHWFVLYFVALVAAWLLRIRGKNALALGFLAGLLIWFGLAYFIDVKNDHILIQKMTVLFNLEGGWTILLITGLFGGLLGGLGGILGALIGNNTKNNELNRELSH